MKTRRKFLVGILILLGCFGTAGIASASILFGHTQTFENETVGNQPDSWYDGSNYGDGSSVAVVASGTGGVQAGPTGGTQFIKVTAGDPGSFEGTNRDGPTATIGSQVAFPTSGDRYATFIDVFAQAAPNSNGHLYWDSVVYNNATNTFGADTGWYMVPGATTWQFNAASVGTVDLAVDSWYTLEVIFDRSGSSLTSTYNIYNQGQRGAGAPLASFAGGPSAIAENLPSAKLGGPWYQWITNWDEEAIDYVYFDNAGTGDVSAVSVPTPSSLGLLALAGVLMGWSLRFRTKKNA